MRPLVWTILCVTSLHLSAAEPVGVNADANVPVELAFTAARAHDDPFNTVTMDVHFTSPNGDVLRVPAFWDGGTKWKVRYASRLLGTHAWRSECSDNADNGLHAVSGTLTVSAYRGANALFLHGPMMVASDKRHLEYADGTPFFWLGDTWWMGLSQRLHFPDEFAQLAADRVAKGFTVVQLTAGLFPDMPPFDPRGANEGGFPWEPEYARIRPEYFDAADKRISYLVEHGLSPCIVGAWGYFLPWMGEAKAQAHWRYLIARYAAYPVTWCVAGEANLPYYLAKGFPYDDRAQVRGWTKVTASLRATDPFHRMVTTHPTGMGALNARSAIDDPALLDFDMLQTPHGEKGALAPTIRAIQHAYAQSPAMPVVNGEAAFEALWDRIAAEWPRKMFWICMFNGAAGHTYGANGIWQLNRKGDPHGKSPHGGTYGTIAWDDAMKLPGSAQMGFGKTLFESLPWTQLTPMPESVQWAGGAAATVWGDWIWYPEGDAKVDAPVGARYFRGTFDLPAKTPARAMLQIAADDAFNVWINGEQAGSGADWHNPQSIELAKLLRPGRNVIAVRAENRPTSAAKNPAGLIASLKFDEQIPAATVFSNDQWRAAKDEQPNWRAVQFDDSTWEHARSLARYGDGPWGRIGSEPEEFTPFALGAGSQWRMVYALENKPVTVSKLIAKGHYSLSYFDPVTGTRSEMGSVQADDLGRFVLASQALNHDWVAVLKKLD